MKLKFYWAILISILFIEKALAQEFILKDGSKLSVEQCINKAKQKDTDGDYREASNFFNMAGTMLWENKKYPEAIAVFEQSIVSNQKIGNDNGIAVINNNLGMIYADNNEYEKALIYFQKALEYRRVSKNKIGIITSLINISIVLNNLKRYAESAVLLEESLVLARETKDMEQMRSCYGMLSETYEKGGNSKLSIHYFNLYKTFHEMLQKNKMSKLNKEVEVSKMQALLAEIAKKNKELELYSKNKELAEKEVEISDAGSQIDQLNTKATKREISIKLLAKTNQLLEKTNQLKELTIKQEQDALQTERIYRYFLFGGLAFVLAFSGFVLKNYFDKRKTNLLLSSQNIEINRKNEHITSSINYAKLIQKAILPTSEKIKSYFPNSFVFFKPRDIVSGDFYYMQEIDQKIIVAAIDCTGHGVPGAFMSMVGNNLLHKIIAHYPFHTDIILNELNKGIVNSLQQKENNNKDGMDLAMVIIDKKSKKMEFSGAKNPLLYIQNGEINIIRGDKMPLGGNSKDEKVYTRHIIDISRPTTIYLTTDGFQDEFGGKDGEKKYGSRRLREFLLTIYTKSFDEQHELIESEINTWMGPYKQIDDILLIGIKV